MMANTLYTQLYLNTLLLQDIASILIGGYYSNKSFTPYLQVLNTNEYYVPIDYISSLSAPPLQLISVSIYI